MVFYLVCSLLWQFYVLCDTNLCFLFWCLNNIMWQNSLFQCYGSYVSNIFILSSKLYKIHFSFPAIVDCYPFILLQLKLCFNNSIVWHLPCLYPSWFIHSRSWLFHLEPYLLTSFPDALIASSQPNSISKKNPTKDLAIV